MKISDALIIYFSAGAPVAVYFYFQHRFSATTERLWRGSLYTFLFWIPAAARLAHKQIDFFQHSNLFGGDEKDFSQSENAEKLYRLQKQLEKILEANGSALTLFEFRETVERYVGLTCARQIETVDASVEFFRAAQNNNPELAAKCFGRRNRQRLFFHQTSARRDFLQILARLSGRISDADEINRIAHDFAEILNDSEARKTIGKMFSARDSSDETLSSELLERDLWKPDTERPSPQQPTAFDLISTLMQTTDAPQTATATRSSRKE